jgi:hypothetical protein
MFVARLKTRAISLEECILRILYEAPATADECTAQVVASLGRGRLEPDVRRTLSALIAGAYLAPHAKPGVLRYTLSPRGSERLACLVEGSAQPKAG